MFNRSNDFFKFIVYERHDDPLKLFVCNKVANTTWWMKDMWQVFEESELDVKLTTRGANRGLRIAIFKDPWAGIRTWLCLQDCNIVSKLGGGHHKTVIRCERDYHKCCELWS